MSQFTTLLKVTPYGDGHWWCLLEDFSFEYGDPGKSVIITAPKLFMTDFASIPREFWNILPPWGLYGFAATIHDWLYYNQETTKDYADDVLMEGMKVIGVGIVDRDIIYEAVKHAGQSSWDDNKRKKDIGFIRVADELPRSVMTTGFEWTGK